jgi:hypothetical protein
MVIGLALGLLAALQFRRLRASARGRPPDLEELNVEDIRRVIRDVVRQQPVRRGVRSSPPDVAMDLGSSSPEA